MVEILMAVWNGGSYLAEQIESILRQDSLEWVLTISDDGSTDGSDRVIDSYAEKYPDKIRRYRSGKRFGNARDHFFHLMAQGREEHLLFCDQDDVWHPDKVRKFEELFAKAEAEYGKETPILVFSDQAVVDEHLKMLSPSLMKLQQQNPYATDYRNILYQNIVTGCTSGVNRALASLAARCLHPKKTVMHDWWLALTAAKFGKLVYLGESTIDYRQHGGNSVGAKDVSSLGYLAHKLLHRGEMEKNRQNKKVQAQTFLETYENLLTEEEKACLANYAAGRSPLLWKLSFLPYIGTLKRKLGFLVMY